MNLVYEAMDKSGQIVSDSIEAADVHEATEMLRREGLFVTELSEAGMKPLASRKNSRVAAGKGNQLKNVAMFTRQLSVLVSTGTPLVQAIGALEKQSKNENWRVVVSTVRQRLEGGDSFSKALEVFPRHFDSIYRSLIEAGELGGHLDEMLTRLAKLTQNRIRVRNIVIGAMAYPLILIVVAFSVLGIMIGFVLPRFTGLFETLDAPLPPTTLMLLSLSDLIKSYWWAMMFGAVAGVFGWLSFCRSQFGKRSIDSLILKIPTFGAIFRNFATARMIRLLGILLDSRVPLLDALNLTREGCKNFRYSELIAEAGEAVTRGENVSMVMARSDLVDPTIAEALRCGEQTGQMGSVLLTISDFLDEENEVVLKSLSSIIEPIILIVLGVLVGFVAVSMFMPLFDITAAVPGGGG